MSDDDYTLTSDDIKAIKQANSVVVFWRPDRSEGPESGVRLGRDVYLAVEDAERQLARIARSGLWTRDWMSDYSISYHRTIPAGCTPQVTHYGDGQATSAVAVFTSFQHHASVRSVFNFLKVGDRIGVCFVGSNNNETLKAARLHSDECYLRILRGKQQMEFLLDTVICPDNTARMVQHT